jgi:asparagine synthase (glutamine-hydrolysing)
MDFFYFGTYNSIQEDTFFEGINELPGGSFFLVDLKKGAIEVNPQKYWEINLENKIRYKNDDQYSERYFEIFRNSVEIQLRSDVPVGSALSGGLDSSGIVCMISELMKEKNISQKQITFTATSDISQFDESFYANSVIKHANVEPYFTQPSHNQLLIDYSKLIWHQEEPFISTSIFAGWCVAKLVHENGVVVSLDGQGPDEMMGGYYPYASVLLQNIKSGNLSLFHSNLNYYRKQLNIHGINVILSIIRNSIPSSVKNTSKLFSNLFIDRHTIYKKEMWNGKLSLYQNKFPYEVKSKNPFDNYSFNSTRLQPLPGILKQVDRNSMAFSIESRVPFLDHRLVEFTFAIPIEQKVNGVSKYVYRNAIKHLLPNEINNRKSKLGFVTAEPIWLKNRNLSSLLNNSFENSDEDSIFNSDVISKQFNDFLKGERPFSADYWKFFNYLEWLKLFKNI